MRQFKYDVLQLINDVKDRPCLWDKTIENYKDRVERRHAWEEIFCDLEETYNEMTAEEKRLTGEHILNKWTNIRDTFLKTLKTRMGRPRRKYLLHEELKFLLKVVPDDQISPEYNSEEATSYNNEPTSYNMKQEEVDTFTVTSEEQEPIIAVSDVTSYNKKRSKRSDFDNAKSTEYNEVSYDNKRKSKRYTAEDKHENDTFFIKKKSKKNVTASVEITNDIPTDIDFVEVDNNDPRIMNEDEAFFASLLPTVVKYSEDERLEFRIEVLGVMKQIKEKRKWTTE